MKNLYLLNLLSQSFKEKNLIFQEAAPAATAPAPEAPAPAAAPAAPEAKEEVTKDTIKEKVKELKKKLADVLDDKNKDKYTDALKKSAKDIDDKLKEIGDKVDDKTDKKNLEKFDADLKKFDAKTLAADAEVKKFKDAIKAKKEGDSAITAEKIAAGVLKTNSAHTLTEDQKKALDAKIKASLEKREKDLDAVIKDPKSTPEAIKAAATAAITEAGNFTVETLAASTEAELKDIEKQRTLAEKVFGLINPEEKDGKRTFEFKIEDLEKVMGTYDLGKYDSPKDKATAATIMEELRKNAATLKGDSYHIDIGFFGGTDATNFKDSMESNPSFNKAKKEAFEGILKFAAEIRIPPALTPDISADKPLIEAYNKAVTDNKVKDFMDKDGNRAKFFNGGGLFDLALAYQRASDRKAQFYKGDKDATADTKKLDPKVDTLDLIRGTSNDTEAERTSGIKFIDTTPSEKKEDVVVKEITYDIREDGKILVVTTPVPGEKSKETTYVLTPIKGGKLSLSPTGKPQVEIKENPNASGMNDGIMDIKVDLKTGLPTSASSSDGYEIEVSGPEGSKPGVITVEENKEPPALATPSTPAAPADAPAPATAETDPAVKGKAPETTEVTDAIINAKLSTIKSNCGLYNIALWEDEKDHDNKKLLEGLGIVEDLLNHNSKWKGKLGALTVMIGKGGGLMTREGYNPGYGKPHVNIDYTEDKEGWKNIEEDLVEGIDAYLEAVDEEKKKTTPAASTPAPAPAAADNGSDKS